MSELLAQPLHGYNADSIPSYRHDSLGTLLRAEGTRLLQVLIGEGSDVHLAHKRVAQPRLVTQGYQGILTTLLHFSHGYRVSAEETSARV